MHGCRSPEKFWLNLIFFFGSVPSSKSSHSFLCRWFVDISTMEYSPARNNWLYGIIRRLRSLRYVRAMSKINARTNCTYIYMIYMSLSLANLPRFQKKSSSYCLPPVRATSSATSKGGDLDRQSVVFVFDESLLLQIQPTLIIYGRNWKVNLLYFREATISLNNFSNSPGNFYPTSEEMEF